MENVNVQYFVFKVALAYIALFPLHSKRQHATAFNIDINNFIANNELENLRYDNEVY